MTTHVPYGAEHAAGPADYPQFATGNAQYPPAPDHYGPPRQHAAGPHSGAYQPPAPAYPTAPPWAAAAPQSAPVTAEVPAAYGAVAPYGQPMPEYGGLLVPYPDEMRHAPQAQAPAVWPVVVFTFLFLYLGALSAGRRARLARSGRNSASPYWLTFLITLVVANMFWLAVTVFVGVPFVNGVREGIRLEAVERNVVQDGQLKQARITATAARCHAVSERDSAGMRDYLCQLTLADGRSASLSLTADPDGNWTSQPGG
jgi:hypothetical protein